MPVYDTYKENRRVVAEIAKGTAVLPINGVVVTLKPGLIRMDRDLPDQNLVRGDTLLIYGYSSEGFSTVWLKGRYYGSYDISFTKWPDGSGCGNGHCAATCLDPGEKAWWAEVKLASGAMGWVEMDAGK